MDTYLSWIYALLLEIALEGVHLMILRVIISHWYYQSLSILEYLDVVYFWLYSFAHAPLSEIHYFTWSC